MHGATWGTGTIKENAMYSIRLSDHKAILLKPIDNKKIANQYICN